MNNDFVWFCTYKSNKRWVSLNEFVSISTQVLFRCTLRNQFAEFFSLFDNINQKHLDLKYPSIFLLTLYNACVVPSFFVDRFEMLVTDPAMSVTNIDVTLRPTSWSESCRVQTVVYYELPEPNRQKYSEIVQTSFREMIILFFHFLGFSWPLSESSSGNSFACIVSHAFSF